MGVWKKQKTFRITRDLMRLLQKEHLLIFQSTLPDPRSRAPVTAIARFPSTLPERGETFRGGATIGLSTFQSTLPAWGETLVRVHPGHGRSISIHSPHMGRDPGRLGCWPGKSNFNPLSPHGERRLWATNLSPPALRFQSTLPAWGETGACRKRQGGV